MSKEKKEPINWQPLPFPVQINTSNKDCVILFDNGEIRGYDDKWPMAMATHYLLVEPI